MDEKKANYQIEFHRMCRGILKLIHDFKVSTGTERVVIETTDFELDDEMDVESGKFLKPGGRLGIRVYFPTSDDEEDDEEGWELEVQDSL